MTDYDSMSLLQLRAQEAVLARRRYNAEIPNEYIQRMVRLYEIRAAIARKEQEKAQ